MRLNPRSIASGIAIPASVAVTKPAALVIRRGFISSHPVLFSEGRPNPAVFEPSSRAIFPLYPEIVIKE
jgi:hypothetical protein